MKNSFYLNRFKNIFQDNLLIRIIKNSGIILFGNTTASALNLISFTLIAKQLGPVSLAILVLAQTYTLIINDLFNIQTWESMIKFGSEEFKNKSGITNIIKTNITLDMISAVVAFAFALALLRPAAYILNWDVTYLNVFSLYCFSILFNITTLTIGIPRLFDRFVSVAKVQVGMAIVKLGSVLCVMFFADSFINYIYIYLSIEVLTNLSLIIYSMGLLRSNYGAHWWKKGFKIEKDQIKFIWWSNLRTVIRIPVRHFDMVVISSVISMHMVGVYKVYKELAGLIGRVGEPINQSIFPEFTKLIGSNDIHKTISVTKKSMLLLFGIGAIICVSLLIASNFLVGTFFGEQYLMDINALYLMIILFGISFITVPINSLFIAAGFVRSSFQIVVFTNTIYLLTAFYFGKVFGIYGIVIAYALQMVFNQGIKIFLLKKYSTGWSNTIR
jgi:O-antigen/teichoic acid export membrane protein